MTDKIQIKHPTGEWRKGQHMESCWTEYVGVGRAYTYML